jgi:hypothetical protein
LEYSQKKLSVEHIENAVWISWAVVNC